MAIANLVEYQRLVVDAFDRTYGRSDKGPLTEDEWVVIEAHGVQAQEELDQGMKIVRVLRGGGL